MKACNLVPHGWLCTIEECPPGHFVWLTHCIGFKSEYIHELHDEGPHPMCFNEAGEYIHTERVGLVQPLVVNWEEE